MSTSRSERALTFVLRIVGVVFTLGVIPLGLAFPNGWRWYPDQPPYRDMIIGVYATLGLFLLWASKNPGEHRSLIWFTVWSSAVHAAVMAVHSVMDPARHGHLMGDVPFLFITAIVLAVLLRQTNPRLIPE